MRVYEVGLALLAVAVAGYCVARMSRSGENASADSSCMINGIFHERQRRELCALHALNNVFQHKEFSKGTSSGLENSRDEDQFF